MITQPTEVEKTRAQQALSRRRPVTEGPTILQRGWDGALLDPSVDVVRVEAEQVTPLHQRNPALAHEATHVPHGHSEAFCYLVDVHERRPNRR